MTIGRPQSDLTRKIVATWTDDRYRGAEHIARELGCSVDNVRVAWRRAQQRGEVPSGRRASYFLQQRSDLKLWPHDDPITVDKRGPDPLLRALNEQHALDPRRVGDDMTARLQDVALRVSRGRCVEEFLA